MAALIAIALLGFKTRPHLIGSTEYRSVAALMSQVGDRVPHRSPVLIVGRVFAFDAGVVFELRRKGLHVGDATGYANELGGAYIPGKRRFAQTLEIGNGRRLPGEPPVIAQVTEHSQPPETVTVGLLNPR